MVISPFGIETINNMTLSGFLALADDSDQLFGSGEQAQTWREAVAQVALLATIWRGQGIRKVALYCDNAEHFAVSLLSCVVAQVEVCVPASLNPENMAWLAQSADVLLSDLPNVADLSVQMPVLSLPAVLSASSPVLVSQQNFDFTTDISLSLQTSGSSGQSKIIQKSWRQMLAEAQAILARLPEAVLTTPVVVLSSVSQQHMYGLSFRIVMSLLAGWRIDAERLMYPEAILGRSAKMIGQKIVWVSSPTLLQALNEQHDFASIGTNVALVVSSGGALNSHSKTWLANKLACPVLEIYGSTETGVVAYRDEDRHWQFFDGVCPQVLPEEGLRITAPWCEAPQVLADAIVWHGQAFELLGRVDRIIKLADKRISLLQLEAHLLSHPWVKDGYIAKHPQASHLAAWVALNDEGVTFWRDQGRKALISSMKHHFQGQLDVTALPRYWRFDTALPRNSQSKLTQQDFHVVLQQPKQAYIWLSEAWVSEDEYVLHACVPIDLQYFNGHFDGLHLVPGVVQLKWVLAALNHIGWLAEDPPRQWENLKFQHFLRPNDVFSLCLTRDLGKGKISFQCRYGDTKIASGRFVMPNKAHKA